jgi:hypothetical protein
VKFKNIGTRRLDNVYGYSFPFGVPVEVVEEQLIRKFSLYYDLEEVCDGLQEQGQETGKARPRAPAKARAMTRSELKAEADELGISYKPQVRTRTLREQVTAHGYKD